MKYTRYVIILSLFLVFSTLIMAIYWCPLSFKVDGKIYLSELNSEDFNHDDFIKNVSNIFESKRVIFSSIRTNIEDFSFGILYYIKNTNTPNFEIDTFFQYKNSVVIITKISTNRYSTSYAMTSIINKYTSWFSNKYSESSYSRIPSLYLMNIPYGTMISKNSKSKNIEAFQNNLLKIDIGDKKIKILNLFEFPNYSHKLNLKSFKPSFAVWSWKYYLSKNDVFLKSPEDSQVSFAFDKKNRLIWIHGSLNGKAINRGSFEINLD